MSSKESRSCLLNLITCEPDGASSETTQMPKDLASLITGNMMLLFGHICRHLQSLNKEIKKLITLINRYNLYHTFANVEINKLQVLN